MQHAEQQEAPVISLIQITKDLTSIINEEMDYLKTNRPAKIKQFQKQKNILTASYHKELNHIKLNGGLASSGNGEIVRNLKKESRIFQNTLQKHTRFIKAKKILSEQMIRNISEEVANQKGVNSKYGPNAKMERSKSVNNSISIAINKSI